MSLISSWFRLSVIINQEAGRGFLVCISYGDRISVGKDTESRAEEHSEYRAQMISELLCLCASPDGFPLVDMVENALCISI